MNLAQYLEARKIAAGQRCSPIVKLPSEDTYRWVLSSVAVCTPTGPIYTPLLFRVSLTWDAAGGPEQQQGESGDQSYTFERCLGAARGLAFPPTPDAWGIGILDGLAEGVNSAWEAQPFVPTTRTTIAVKVPTVMAQPISSSRKRT